MLGYIGFVDAHTQKDCAAGGPGVDLSSSSSSAPFAAAPVTVGDVLRGAASAFVGSATSVATLGGGGGISAAAPSGGGGGTSPCQLKSNFLAMFGTDLDSSGEIYAFTARLALLFQLFTVFPLLLLIIRTQGSSLLMGKAYPGAWRVYILNFIVMGITFGFAAADLQISEVLRFVGAIGGFIIVFAVPAGIDYMKRKEEETQGATSYMRQGFVVLVGIFFMVLQFLPGV